jgi:hypothetical protein
VPRFFRFLAGWLLLLAFARAEKPALLLEALTKSAADEAYWAYTETSRELDQKGRSSGDTIVRFDPSKPYAEQFTPVLIEGKPPTAKQRKEYRQRGLDRGKEIESEPEQENSAASAEISFDTADSSLDFDRARIIADDGPSVTYEVPLRKTGRGGPPVEKIQLVIRVNRDRRALESMTTRLLSPVRLMLVIKINPGELKTEYTVVDPKYPPVMTSFGGKLTGSLLFLKDGGTLEEKRTEFQRVKPYGDRFRVKIGPLKALPF